MLSRAAVRATTQVAGRRGFHATRSQMSSPYHYPEGPYSNIPFNPRKKTFPIMFWTYCATGFGAPFAIAGASSWSPFIISALPSSPSRGTRRLLTFCFRSLANLQAQGIESARELVGGRRVKQSIVYDWLWRPGGLRAMTSRIELDNKDDSAIRFFCPNVFCVYY